MKNFKNIILVTFFTSIVAACGTTETEQVQAQGATVQVDVAPVVVESIATYHEFTGTMQAPEIIELRPRISGYIDAVHFIEGSAVQAGDLLFSIDNKPVLAEVERLRAELSIASSQYLLAQKEYQRAQKLISTNAIAKELLDNREANLQQSQSRMASVQAALDAANLQLSYTQITAPISGLASSAFITKGNFVSAGESVLTTLVANDKLYTYFDANQHTLLAYKTALQNAQVMPVLLDIDVAQSYNLIGEIDFIDNQFNTQTGTIRARAVVNNADDMLVPGLFARLRVYSEISQQTILIQDAAIGTDLSNKYVLVMNNNNILEYRTVTLGEKVEELRVITTGLNPGEKIVVNGLQRVRAGQQVSPIDVDMTSELTLSNIHTMQETIASLIDQTGGVIAQQHANAVSTSNAGALLQANLN